MLEVKQWWIAVLATAGFCAGIFATVSVLAVAASAQASPTLAPDQPCYRAYDGSNSGVVTVQGTGFTPSTALATSVVSAAYNLKGPTSAPPTAWDHPADPNALGPAAVQPDGSVKPVSVAEGITNPLGAQTQRVGTVPVALVEYQYEYQPQSQSYGYQPDGVFARVDVKVVNFGITALLLGKGKYIPRRSVRVEAGGYFGNPTLYEHYVYVNPLSSAQTVKKTIALGTPLPPCGILVTTVRRWPIRHPAKGRWLLVFNTTAKPVPTPQDIVFRAQVR